VLIIYDIDYIIKKVYLN